MARRDEPAPLTRPIEVASVGVEGLNLTMRASEVERAALAADYGLVAVDDLTATFALKREPRSGLSVRGTVEAKVHQTCVVTLDPFPAQVSETVDVHCLPEADVAAFEARMRLASAADGTDLSEANVPDRIVDGRVDLGILAAEFLALALDPYPRKPGAAFAEPSPPDADGSESPFAALIKFRDGGPS